MPIHYSSIKDDEILRLAAQAKLMIADGDSCFLNDMAGKKELMAFARLLEFKLRRSGQMESEALSLCADS